MWCRRKELGNMTREEEAIKMLKSKMDGNTDTSYEWAETVRLAIKALEQESILDKIYADIQKLRGCSCWDSDGIIDDVEDIIDKYTAESEDKE